MLVGRADAGSKRLKSMHLVLLAIKSSWRPRKECCMALKLIWRLDSTVSEEGAEVYRMVSDAQMKTDAQYCLLSMAVMISFSTLSVAEVHP